MRFRRSGGKIVEPDRRLHLWFGIILALFFFLVPVGFLLVVDRGIFSDPLGKMFLVALAVLSATYGHEFSYRVLRWLINW
jgi:hypothetical protein